MRCWFLLECCWKARPPAERLEGFSVVGCFNPTPRWRGTFSILKRRPVHPLDGGEHVIHTEYTGSSPRLRGKFCLFGSRSFKTYFSKLPIRQCQPYAADHWRWQPAAIWRVQLTGGLVDCSAIVLICQISDRSSSQVIRCASASSRI